MAMRERIEAFLKVRDGQRFKQSMKGAARSVREFGEDTEHTVAKLELLRRIDKKLEKQGAALALVLEMQERHVRQLGNEAVKSAAKVSLLTRSIRALRRSGDNFGSALRTWKDRLSLTASEVKTTAFTLGAYLSPALIELGVSASAALLGGGIVGAGGIAALGTGILGLGLIGATVAGQMKKITTAQNAYNLAVAQYGAGSKEAAKASAKLYGVIQTQGGTKTWEAVLAIRALKSEWTKATAPARGSLANIMTTGINGARRMLPTFADQTNRNASSLSGNLKGAVNTMSGNDARKTLRMLGATFRNINGPLLRGFASAFLVVGRILRASGPWVIRWAQSWERVTMSWRRGTSDSKKVSGFIRMLMVHFSAWWRLTKALGNTLRILFLGAQNESGNLVLTIAKLVEKFNVWFDLHRHNGDIERFFKKYNDAVKLLFSNPQGWLDKYIPTLSLWVTNSLIPWIGKTAASLALHAGTAFAKGWLQMDLGAKLFTVAYLFKGFIFTRMATAAAALFLPAFQGRLGKLAGSSFWKNFGMKYGGLMAAGLVIGLSGAISVDQGKLKVNWAQLRTTLLYLLPWIALTNPQVAAAIALTIGASFLWDQHKKKADAAAKARGAPLRTKPNEPGGLTKDFTHHGTPKRAIAPPDRPSGKRPGRKGRLKHKAAGGTIPWGTDSWVGENGPERARASAGGVQIMPAGYASSGGGGLRSLEPMLSVSDMLPPIVLINKVDGREISRAYHSFTDKKKSKRGERP